MTTLRNRLHHRARVVDLVRKAESQPVVDQRSTMMMTFDDLLRAVIMPLSTAARIMMATITTTTGLNKTMTTMTQTRMKLRLPARTAAPTLLPTTPTKMTVMRTTTLIWTTDHHSGTLPSSLIRFARSVCTRP